MIMMSPVAAQQPTALATGERLRVYLSTSRDPFEGTFEGVDQGELRLGGALGERRLRLAEIIELRRDNGIRARTLAGAIAGYAIGSLAGTVASSGGSNDTQRERGAAIGGLLGLATGALIGHGQQATRWSTVSPSVVRPQPLPGTRVRIERPAGGELEGLVVRRTRDSLFVSSRQAAAAVGVALADSLVIQWPASRKRPILKGAGIGLLIGGLSGAVIGAASASNCTGEFLCFSAGSLAVAGAVGFGVLGAGLGALIGAASHETVWETSSIPRQGLSIRPTLGRGTFGLAGSLRLALR